MDITKVLAFVQRAHESPRREALSPAKAEDILLQGASVSKRGGTYIRLVFDREIKEGRCPDLDAAGASWSKVASNEVRFMRWRTTVEAIFDEPLDKVRQKIEARRAGRREALLAEEAAKKAAEAKEAANIAARVAEIKAKKEAFAQASMALIREGRWPEAADVSYEDEMLVRGDERVAYIDTGFNPYRWNRARSYQDDWVADLNSALYQQTAPTTPPPPAKVEQPEDHATMADLVAKFGRK